MTKSKNYIIFFPDQPQGYPSGKNVYYECEVCGDVVESKPQNFAECTCQNITVDSSGGRLTVTDPNKFKIFRN